MRESRTYGSVRGACDETHVPTATSQALQSVPSKARTHIVSEPLAWPARTQVVARSLAATVM